MKILKKTKRGTAMIETLFEMAIIFTLIASFIVLFPPFITNMKLTFCTKEIVRAIEVSGSVKDNDVRDTAILEEAGTSLNNVVKTSIFLKDLNDFEAVNEVYGTYFIENKPARSCVQVAKLPKDAVIEIEAIAVK